ncbi:L-fucose:H+ symporter permease [Burkholderia lata]|uniref:Sugar transporter n=1 Tax=Burkholderia lata (strain ATCC 17760 / DSM 23089 / LMG 22485 / NCIMB 9086 / R18194 / 383) TaxID=482957 RepID=A0A6P2LUT7_BURL3|nr:L-fucose:H+ symporter permease [Burkholderia lata]VWB70306.1 sugar transporter [Burkholderia lata]VWB76546.1 sugar transporter [Burkholderia lata]
MGRARIEHTPDGYYLNRTPLFAFTLLCCLFALWGTAANLNDVLIAQFKKSFFLSDFESAFVQSAFYLGYFFLAIPAATVVKKFSYKTTILVGLLLYTTGCLLFFPAASMAKYGMFLVALFVIAAGLSFLETASNSYSTLMGPRETSTRRLNISQTFYPFGAMAGVYMGSFLIFKEGDASHAQLAAMSAAEAHVHQLAMIQATLEPYKWLIVVLVAVFIVFALTPYPACKGNGPGVATHRIDARGTLARLFGNRRFVAGVVAQFLYVGAQVGVWSFTIRLAMQIGGLTERDASHYLLATFFAFFVGKLVATLVMKRVGPAKVLIVYGILCIALLAYTISVHNITAVYAAVGVSVFLGPCWPTIYGLTIDGLGKDTEYGGSILVMSIVGGAVVPLIQGLISDHTGGNMQLAFVVPLACFVVIVYYGFYCLRHLPAATPGTAADGNAPARYAATRNTSGA